MKGFYKYWPQLAVIVLFVLGYGAYKYFAYYDTRSSDAFVSAQVLSMSSIVPGLITKVYVKENQKVQKGDKLIEVDPSPYILEVQQAKAEFNSAQLKSDENGILAAKAELDKANYLLAHTTLIAPEEGYISNFNLQVGSYVAAGTGLFALIETKQWWVVTHYRETAIRLIKPGDRAIIKLDMYPGKVFHGHVESIGWGINREQPSKSTLVYLQPTEDWIRISQRFPVRILLDDMTEEYPMRIGASATSMTYR